jgi:hypothetical protein
VPCKKKSTGVAAMEEDVVVVSTIDMSLEAPVSHTMMSSQV